MQRCFTRRRSAAIACGRQRWGPRVSTSPLRRISTTTIEKLDEEGRSKTHPTNPSNGSLRDNPFEARSLLRALLRECSYLPDSFARDWTKVHILHSFRSSERKLQNLYDDADHDGRLPKVFRDGRKALSQLQRAVQGDMDCLEKVLMMTYGRVGKRRRELLQPVLPEPRSDGVGKAGDGRAGPYAMERPHTGYAHVEGDPAAQQTTSSADSTPRISKFQPHTLPRQLHQLLQSQMQYSPPTHTRSNPRRLKASIPELNTWLRPMPQKRVKNMESKFYADLLNRALPPLPQNEWERLRDLASGKMELEMPKRRQSVQKAVHQSMSALEVAVRYGKVPRRITQIPHDENRANARSMRRLYAKVFSQCPLMQYDEERDKWQVTWGEEGLLKASSEKRHERAGIGGS